VKQSHLTGHGYTWTGAPAPEQDLRRERRRGRHLGTALAATAGLRVVDGAMARTQELRGGLAATGLGAVAAIRERRRSGYAQTTLHEGP
jgi:hypothetical protein